MPSRCVTLTRPAAPPNTVRMPPPPRRRGSDDDGGMLYKWFLPKQNRAARWGYFFALVGLVPFVGLLAGLFAVPLCAVGWVRGQRDPNRDGLGHAVAGVIAGTLEVAANAVAIWLIARGNEWV